MKKLFAILIMLMLLGCGGDSKDRSANQDIPTAPDEDRTFVWNESNWDEAEWQ